MEKYVDPSLVKIVMLETYNGEKGTFIKDHKYNVKPALSAIFIKDKVAMLVPKVSDTSVIDETKEKGKAK